MQKAARKIGFGLAVTALMSALALPASAQTFGRAIAEGEYATEGYFAILIVEEMRRDVRQTWNAENAIAALSQLGMEPLDGWDANATLTEGAMVHMLRFIDIAIFTENAEREVTKLEARSIIKKFRREFVANIEDFILNDNTTTTSVDDWTLEHPSP
ncbi:MAG: hypothetical protein AAF533_02750 [Acidobacteriota bacterium]